MVSSFFLDRFHSFAFSFASSFGFGSLSPLLYMYDTLPRASSSIGRKFATLDGQEQERERWLDDFLQYWHGLASRMLASS
jgi:hypothetical protein